MRNRNCYTIAILWLAFLLTGCGPSFKEPDENGIQTNDSTIPPLTLEILKNSEYQALNGSKLIQLVDGKYEVSSGSDTLTVRMLDEVAFGDLNSDGVQDAAILLVENLGGTGDFYNLVPVFNNDGAPSPSSGYHLGDRVIVNSVIIADQLIHLEMLVQAPNDPLCCPSLPMRKSFKFYWGPGLVEVQVSSGTSAQGMRTVEIENPIDGGIVSNPFRLSGKVSIAPFENTLMVKILDSNEIPVYQGPVMVIAPDIGSPGTFDADIDLSGSPVLPGKYRIEILDVSMADGSILAMDSIDIQLK